MKNSNKFNSLVAATDTSIVKEAEWRMKNRNWLQYSQMIAMVVLLNLKSKNISQKELAEKMSVSPQYVNKVVKGKEKLNLETIAKLEEAIGISLIKIQMPIAKEKPIGRTLHIDFRRDISKHTYDMYKIAK